MSDFYHIQSEFDLDNLRAARETLGFYFFIQTPAKTTMTKDEVQAIVGPFYKQALTVNTETTSSAVLEKILAASFQSINSQGTKDKATLIQQVAGFWKLIPDLVWATQDLVFGTDGKKVVVRAVASGSPKGNFLGMELDGSKSFRIDTTDIHEIENGQIVRVHHLEDWATGMKQLKS